MDYTAENIDVKAFEAALNAQRNNKMQEKIMKVKEAEAYFGGYEDAIYRVIDMLHCKNYEKGNN